MSPIRRLHHYYAISLVLMFLTALYAPFLGGLLQEDIKVSRLKKRRLASLPAWPDNLRALREFPRQFADYYADHFGFREMLVSWYKQGKYLMGDSPSRDVIVGKDGWVFLGGIQKGYTKYGDPIGDARHVNKFTPAGLRRFAVYLMALSYWLEKQGSRYLFVLAPNKHSIYPEYLPDYVKPVEPESAADQLFSLLKQRTGNALDLRPALRAAKARGQVYFYHDSHWNYLGANYAQLAIREVLARWFPGRITAALFPLRKGMEREGDLNGYIGLLPRPRKAMVPDFSGMCTPRRIPKNAAPRDVHTNICEDGRLRAVIFRDSFFSLLEPYLSRVFARSTLIWTKLDFEVLKRLVQKERPDVVIEEWVERELPRVPDPLPVLKQIVADGMGLVFSVPLNQLRFNQRIRVLFQARKKVILESTGMDPYILLPRLELPDAGAYIVRIRLYSQVKSGLELYYSSGDRPAFSAARVVQRMLFPGENDLYFWFFADEMGTHFRLDPLWGKGQVTLHSVDIISLTKMDNQASG